MAPPNNSSIFDFESDKLNIGYNPTGNIFSKYIMGIDVAVDNTTSNSQASTIAFLYPSGTTTVFFIADEPKKVLTEKHNDRISYNKYGDKIHRKGKKSWLHLPLLQTVSGTVERNLINVQPLSAPSNVIHYLDYQYKTNVVLTGETRIGYLSND